MTEDDGEDGGVLATQGPRVLVLRDQPVMLAPHVAQAFGVETRELRQAVKRNDRKFTEKHVFELTDDERESLRSQGVISGRGWAPLAFTQKGIVRLATVLDSDKALGATDEIIDLFLSIYGQLRQGQSSVVVSNPSRLVPDEEDATEIRKLRKRIVKAIGDLLDTTVDAKGKTTVADVLGETATGLRDHLNAWLKSPQIKNEQIAAETLKILEQTRDIYERRQADLKKSRAETEKIVLDNVDKKIDLIKKMLKMTDEMEPSVLAQMLPQFTSSGLALPAPKRSKPSGERD
jgi:hypothetical protein